MTEPFRPVLWPALREFHSTAGAVFAERSGWMLPERYGDLLVEHEAIRGQVALADRSHVSRILVTGTDALDVLQKTFAGQVGELEEGRAMRTVSLDGAGRISDLVLLARTGGIAYLVAGEAACRAATYERLQQAIEPGWDARVDDRTETTCWLVVTGPEAGTALTKYVSDSLAARVKPMQISAFEFHGFRSLAVRASDTGEDGFALMLAPAVALHLAETFRGAGIAFAGAEAMDIARVEAAIPAWVPDLSTGLTPAQADLDVLLEIPGGDEGSILAGLLIEGEPLPVGSAVLFAGDRIGELRSCVRSPSLGATIGLAIIDTGRATPGTALEVAGSQATVVAKPFFRRRR